MATRKETDDEVVERVLAEQNKEQLTTHLGQLETAITALWDLPPAPSQGCSCEDPVSVALKHLKVEYFNALWRLNKV